MVPSCTVERYFDAIFPLASTVPLLSIPERCKISRQRVQRRWTGRLGTIPRHHLRLKQWRMSASGQVYRLKYVLFYKHVQHKMYLGKFQATSSCLPTAFPFSQDLSWLTFCKESRIIQDFSGSPVLSYRGSVMRRQDLANQLESTTVR